jgi:uncharacterized membrane protein
MKTSAGIHAPNRVPSIDLLRGTVMILMALDHVRMYFGFGTWYADPTDLGSTTPALFFTRWITHFCAPVFVFLAGTSAFMTGEKKGGRKDLSLYLLSRGVWLILAELILINFAWTFDITYSFIILQAIWAIGISLLFLAALVFLPTRAILVIGLLLVFGHNLLDGIELQGSHFTALLWHTLHQPGVENLGGRLVNFVYPTLPWTGLMAMGYACGALYQKDFPAERRRRWLLITGIGSTMLFLLLRGFNLYGEPNAWTTQESPVFTFLSFLNTTKCPPSLHFLLMTMGPALISLSLLDSIQPRIAKPVVTFGRVPFFFYITHLYLIHALAMLYLALAGRDWHEYIFSASGLNSGALMDFGLGLGGVYLAWIFVLLCLYPLCKWYAAYTENHLSQKAL